MRYSRMLLLMTLIPVITLTLAVTVVKSSGLSAAQTDKVDSFTRPVGHEDEHDAHAPEEEAVLRLDPVVLQEFGIETAPAGSGTIAQTLSLPGEVVFNADQLAHVTPTVAGIAKEVLFSAGDRVEKGQVMAVLNSRELAAARSTYLAAQARLTLAQENLKREEWLLQDKVGTERAVLEAGQKAREAEIELNLAENALHALGYSHEQIGIIDELDDSRFNTYELCAPLSGIVINRHLTIGEVVEPTHDEPPFVVADLSNVWVDLTVFQRDLAHVKPGQSLRIHFGHDIPDTTGRISFVSPSLEEATRTATARIVLDNPAGHWRPGLFMTGVIAIGQVEAPVVVPAGAVVRLEERPMVFVQTGEGLEPRPVQVGKSTSEQMEILAGLQPGERVVTHNAFALKAELNRAALSHAGHAH